jgi:hypothetical protein
MVFRVQNSKFSKLIQKRTYQISLLNSQIKNGFIKLSCYATLSPKSILHIIAKGNKRSTFYINFT